MARDGHGKLQFRFNNHADKWRLDIVRKDGNRACHTRGSERLVLEDEPRKFNASCSPAVQVAPTNQHGIAMPVKINDDTSKHYDDRRSEVTQLLPQPIANNTTSGGRSGWAQQATTILHMASSTGDVEIVQLLLQLGADPCAHATVDGHGRTPLHVAAEEGHAQMVQLLAEHGGDPRACSADGSTPLHSAASRGHRDVVKRLVELGANPYARNSHGDTALDMAARAGYHARIMRVLVASLYSIGATDNVRRASAMIKHNSFLHAQQQPAPSCSGPATRFSFRPRMTKRCRIQPTLDDVEMEAGAPADENFCSCEDSLMSSEGEKSCL